MFKKDLLEEYVKLPALSSPIVFLAGGHPGNILTVFVTKEKIVSVQVFNLSEEEEISLVTNLQIRSRVPEPGSLYLSYLERAETFPVKLIKGVSLPFCCHINLRIIRLTLVSSRNLFLLTHYHSFQNTSRVYTGMSTSRYKI